MTRETLPVVVVPDLPVLLKADLEAAKTFARDQHADATRQAYRSDFRIFRDWCATRSLPHFPAAPETISTFIAAEAKAGMKTSTITRRLAAIRYAHVLAGYEPPTNSEAVRATMKGIRRTVGTAPVQKAPATAQRVARMASLCPDSLMGLRDRALLLVGFSGAFRRPLITGDGVELVMRASKSRRGTCLEPLTVECDALPDNSRLSRYRRSLRCSLSKIVSQVSQVSQVSHQIRTHSLATSRTLITRVRLKP